MLIVYVGSYKLILSENNGGTLVTGSDTYHVRDFFKAIPGRVFNKNLSGWWLPLSVEQMAEKLKNSGIGEVSLDTSKSDGVPVEYEIKAFLDDSKILWNEKMIENNIQFQDCILEGAGVYAFYKLASNQLPSWYCIICYKDPKLAPFAEEIHLWLKERGVNTEHRNGTLVPKEETKSKSKSKSRNKKSKHLYVLK